MENLHIRVVSAKNEVGHRLFYYSPYPIPPFMICPLKIGVDVARQCFGEDCAWFVGENCGVKQISLDLSDLRKKLAPKKGKKKHGPHARAVRAIT
jgi:hypothetical protein